MNIISRTTVLPPTGVIRSSSLLFVFLLAFWGPAHTVASQTRTDPQSITDMVVVTDEISNKPVVYIVDEQSAAIYSLTSSMVTSSIGRSDLKEFEVFFRSPELARPSGLAYYNGKLVICARTGSIFELDTTKRNLSLLFKGGELRNPSRIAVSQSGRVAVSNNSGKIVLYDRSNKVVEIKHKFDNPIRLTFSDETLLVLESQGTILSVAAKSIDSDSPLVTRVEMPARVGTDTPSIIDFAFLNGVYYVMGQNQVDAYIRSKGTAIPLFSQPKESGSFSGIATNKEQIVLSDAPSNAVWQIERPIPVTASFQTDATRSLISLYQYLLSQNSLPIQRFIARRNYGSFQDLLREQRIIFGDPSVVSGELVNFVCQLNGTICTSPSSDFSSTNQVVQKGQSLYLPDLKYTEVVGYETKYLAGQTVEDYLSKTFEHNPELRARFTESFLWSLNELEKAETLELQLQSKVSGALMAAPPRRSIPPGSVIKVGKEQDVIAGSVKECGAHFDLGAKTYNLAPRIKNSIKGDGAVSKLPRKSVNSVLTGRLKRLGIDEIQFELDNPTVELGNLNAIRELVAKLPADVSTTPTDSLTTPSPKPAPDARTCLTAQNSPKSYLVVDSVKVGAGRYKIFRDKKLLLLSESEILQYGLLGEPDPKREWSLILNHSYHVAYRLFPWTNPLVITDPATKIIASPRQLRPGGSQDIFALKDVSLLLPFVNRWQLTFLIKESDLTNETSEFGKLKAIHNFTALRAEEISRTSTTLARRDSAAAEEDLSLNTVIQNRKALKEQINYTLRELDSPTPLIIGVGEKPCEVDKKHPDFIDKNGESAWLEEPPAAVDAAAVNVCSPILAGERRVKAEAGNNDHGTHVAGLIGARSNGLVPGLLPSTKLFLVNSTSPATISTTTTVAVQRGVFIFNFSFGLEGNHPDLHSTMSEDWKKQLFIVAVENKGQDLRHSATPLVSWIDDFGNNMIGVGSAIGAAGAEYVLGDWKDSEGKISPGSSYGKKYVHLLAPGQNIFSTASGNTYAPATGASQAAPQVTATAAMLFGLGYREPERMKARLIYTADWFEQLRGKVWGGFLNIKKATWEPERNLLTTESLPETYAMVFDEGSPLRLTIKGVKPAKFYNPNDEESIPPQGLEIPFTDILRIARLTNGAYRVVFLDGFSKQLRIVMDAELSGSLPCRTLEEYQGNAFVSVPCKRLEKVDVTQIIDYVAKVPPNVKF